MGVLYADFRCPVCGYSVAGVGHLYGPGDTCTFEYIHKGDGASLCKVAMASRAAGALQDILESSRDPEVLLKRLVSFWRSYLHPQPDPEFDAVVLTAIENAEPGGNPLLELPPLAPLPTPTIEFLTSVSRLLVADMPRPELRTKLLAFLQANPPGKPSWTSTSWT